jgi:uncharacterized protein
MTRTASPIIRKLDEGTSRAILVRNHVGRIAHARDNQLEIEPIHYVYADGWIYGRTSRGAKTEMTGSGWWPVAFEVDEENNLFRWRSVVVHGGFYLLPVTTSKDDVAQWHRAVELLRSLVPEALTDSDPVPSRTVVFGIPVQEISGREATPVNSPVAEVPCRSVRSGRRSYAASQRPVMLLGKSSALSRHIRSILIAAGYRVLEGAAPESLVEIAKRAEPRVILAPASVPVARKVRVGYAG